MIVKIYDMDHFGRGIARIDNKVCFIPNTLIDEEVDIEIIKDNKRFYEGKVIKIIKESPKRVKPLCKYYGECGGCSLMHMNYESQLEYKVNKVSNILKRYAEIDMPLTIEKCDNEFNYRNKITLHSKNNISGLYKKGTNEIINVDKCVICNEVINNKIKNVNYTSETIIRTNEQNDAIITGQKEDFIKEINGIKYKLNINSFFQVNDNVCVKLLDYVNTNIYENDKVLDLYCGVGTFTLSITNKAKEVLGVEVSDSSYKNSLENLELNSISNVEFKHSKVENITEEITNYYDTLIVDPPRSGIDNKTKEQIIKSDINKIIYISCEPITLARDLKELKEQYEIKSIKLFDMFPQTEHCETVCVLERK